MAAASPPACRPQASSLALRRSGRRRPRSSMARRMRSPTAQCLTTKGETLPRLSCRRGTVLFECSNAHHMQLHKGPLVIKLDYAPSLLHHASSYFLSSYHLITLRRSSSLQSARSAHHNAHLTSHMTYRPPDHDHTTPHHTPHSPHHDTLTIHRRQPTSHANSPSAPPPPVTTPHPPPSRPPVLSAT